MYWGTEKAAKVPEIGTDSAECGVEEALATFLATTTTDDDVLVAVLYSLVSRVRTPALSRPTVCFVLAMFALQGPGTPAALALG
ncbi:hypothetical protein VTO73DRAFT_15312 [Trametes versicolor]